MRIYNYIILTVSFIIFNNDISCFADDYTDSIYVKMIDSFGEEKINMLNKLSIALRENSTEESFAYAKEALDLSKKFSYSKGMADAFLNIGIYYASTGDFKTSKSKLYGALTKYQEIDDELGEASVYNALGRVCNFQGKLKDALLYHQKNLNIQSKLENDKGIAVAYMNMGNVFDDLGDNQNTLSHYLKALYTFKGIKDSLNIARIYNNLGQLNYHKKNYSQAKSYYKKALKLIKIVNNRNEENKILNNLSVLFLDLKNHTMSLYYQLKSLSISKDLQINSEIIISFLNLGNLFKELNDYDKSYSYLDSAMILSLEINDSASIASTQFYFGSLFFQTNDFKQSIINLNNAAIYFKRNHFYSQLINSYALISDLYLKQENHKKSFEYYKLITSLTDSIKHTEQSENLKLLTQRIEASKALELLRKNTELQKAEIFNLYISIILGSIILLILVIGIFMLKSKNKDLQKSYDKLKKLYFFQHETYQVMVNDVKPTLLPLILNIAKVGYTNEFEDLNKSYMNFVNKFDNFLSDYHQSINN